MGQKNQKGTVSITNAEGRIRLRWRYQSVSYSLSLFSYDKKNILQARKIAIQIEQDMVLGVFDTSLAKYKPVSDGSCVFNTAPKYLFESFENWARAYKQIDCNVNMHYYGVRSMLRKWGNIHPEQVLEKLNKESVGSKVYNERLSILKNFFTWLVKQGVWSTNPLEDVHLR